MIRQWFEFVNARPITVLSINALIVIAFAVSLPKLHKDTSPDAYIEPDNPALIYRDQVKEMFSLDDPFVVAIQAPPGETIYDAESLRLVAEITRMLEETDNIDSTRVVSLASEKIILGTDAELQISPAFTAPPTDPDEIRRIREKIENFPIFSGNLVARDGSMTVVVGEMVDQGVSRDTFYTLQPAIEALNAKYRGTIHFAGEASTAGYLDDYISQDARRQYPLVALAIIAVLALCFRRVSGVLLPLAVAIAAAICAMGFRAMMDVPFYAISNGLVVVVISISVADSIHILSEYKEELISGRHASTGAALVYSMTAMFRPITLTSFTTIGGFFGIWIGTAMPPLEAFGLYAMIGVLAAWFYSLSFVPAALRLAHRNKPPAAVWAQRTDAGRDILGQFLSALSRRVVRHTTFVLVAGGIVLGISMWLTTAVKTDYSRIGNFAKSEPIRIADTQINEAMDGSYRLLVVVDAQEPHGILRPEVLKKMERLQEYVLSLPNVQGVTSIVDVLKAVNQGIAGGDPNENRIPDDPDSVAQLFFAYESIGNPADLEDDIDFDQQLALIRLRTDARWYSTARPLVKELERYLAEDFDSEIVQGSLSGRVYLNYHWLKSIDDNHLVSVLVAVVASLVMAAITFRSTTAALFCLFHVVFAVFMVYAVMGWFNIPLSITTAMFAAITIGLGIDFSIHSVERVQALATKAGKVTEGTIYEAFQTTGRALLYNVFALCFGFSALLASNNPTVIDFAALLMVAVAANFIASMTVLPAFLLVTKPRFLTEGRSDGVRESGVTLSRPAALLVPLLAFMSLSASGPAAQAAEPDLAEIVRHVVERPDGAHLIRDVKMTLTDRKGRTRERVAKGVRVDTATERRSQIAFTSPSNIKDTAFLSYEYTTAGAADDKWLYLPAMRRTRRISGADRGEYFLGTDFTYEDLQLEGKVAPEDYAYTFASDADAGGSGLITLEGVPKSAELAQQLGYGRVVVDIDPETWVVHEWRVSDPKGNKLKTVTFGKFEQHGEIWIAATINAANHKTGHSTLFEFTNLDFTTPVAAADLDERALGR
jgi:predicted RND superfamily exporter protein